MKENKTKNKQTRTHSNDECGIFLWLFALSTPQRTKENLHQNTPHTVLARHQFHTFSLFILPLALSLTFFIFLLSSFILSSVAAAAAAFLFSCMNMLVFCFDVRRLIHGNWLSCGKNFVASWKFSSAGFGDSVITRKNYFQSFQLPFHIRRWRNTGLSRANNSTIQNVAKWKSR